MKVGGHVYSLSNFELKLGLSGLWSLANVLDSFTRVETFEHATDARHLGLFQVGRSQDFFNL